MRIMKGTFLFGVGGLLYYGIELLFRGYSHPAMIIVGGICFLLCGELNEVIPWEMPLQLQMAICSVMITAVEFLSGIVLNIWLDLAIWDYSGLPFNVLGQICLPFMAAWFFLAAVAIILDDYLRYWLFHEEKPHYTIRKEGRK